MPCLLCYFKSITNKLSMFRKAKVMAFQVDSIGAGGRYGLAWKDPINRIEDLVTLPCLS